MAKPRLNVIGKANVTSSNAAKGTICRADVLRIIYERRDRFSDRVRSCDIDNILNALNLKHSEAQTVESNLNKQNAYKYIFMLTNSNFNYFLV